MKKLVTIVLLSACSTAVLASEYCVDQYDEELSKVDGELGTLVKRQSEVDAQLAGSYTQIAQLSASLSQAAIKVPPDLLTIQKIGSQINDINQKKSNLESEGYKNNDRIFALKGKIPADLQGKLRGCVEATAPANNLVNLAIQALAILSTGGASLLLPPKALYVDMSAVLNGYPTGGPNSVVNQARESALKALPFGLGNPGNDVGKTLRDPGRLIRCLGGC